MDDHSGPPYPLHRQHRQGALHANDVCKLFPFSDPSSLVTIYFPNNIPFRWCRRHLRFAPKLSVTGGWSSAADDAVVEEDEDDEDGGGGGGKVRLFDYPRIRFH